MKNAERERGDMAKVKWALELSQRSLDDLREGDWLNLKEELLWFVTDAANIGSVKAIVDTVTLEQVRLVQAQFKEAFERLASGERRFGIGLLEGAQVYFGLIAVEPYQAFFQTIQARDFDLAMNLALEARIVNSKICPIQIRRCPECKVVFLYGRKPQKGKNYYCSARCARNAASKAYRDRMNELKKQEERNRAHTSYVKKQRQKFPNAKVGRRAKWERF